MLTKEGKALDHNILNRAEFDNTPRTIKFEARFGAYTDYTYRLPQRAIYCLTSFNWKWEPIPFPPGFARPKLDNPILVSFKSGITASIPSREGVVYRQKPAKILPEDLLFTVDNRNNCTVQITIFIEGTMVRQREGSAPLSHKEILAYISMSPEEQGKLALEEAAVDHLDLMMGGALRAALPYGMASINALPPTMQPLVLQSLPGGQELLKALPGVPEAVKALGMQQPLMLENKGSADSSQLIGDIVSAQPPGSNLSLDHVKQLAEELLKKGWRKA